MRQLFFEESWGEFLNTCCVRATEKERGVLSPHCCLKNLAYPGIFNINSKNKEHKYEKDNNTNDQKCC